MDPDAPSPDQIKPYVMIGPTPEYSITVHKRTFDTGFIVFTILAGLFILGVIIITTWWTYTLTKFPTQTQQTRVRRPNTIEQLNYGGTSSATDPVNYNVLVPEDGSAFPTKNSCLSAPNTVWEDNKCSCEPPFFGSTCARERFDKNYFAIGIVSEDHIGMTILEDNLISNGKTWNVNGTLNSCSDLCDKTESCDSFIYNYPNQCTLLKGPITIPPYENISYSENIDPTLYMKTPSNLIFEDRVFLSTSVLSFPRRYWLVTTTPYFAQIPYNIVTRIDFYPTYIKIDENKDFIGIYTLYQFTPSSVSIMLTRQYQSDCYIHRSGSQFNIPPDWRYKLPIYIYYTTFS